MQVITTPTREYSPLPFAVRCGVEPRILRRETQELLGRYDEGNEPVFEQLVSFARGHEAPQPNQQRQFRRSEADVYVVVSFYQVPGRVVRYA